MKIKTKELQVKPLSARAGQSYSISLDQSSMSMLRHAQEYLVRSMNLKVSNAVLVRRALLLLCRDYYDELIVKCRASNNDKGRARALIDDEKELLEHVSRGSRANASHSDPCHCFSLPEISPTEAFPTYQERMSKVSEIGRDKFLDSLSL